MSRLLADGAVLRLSRGLYQLADAEIDINHDLAEAAKRVPKGVVCLTSALAYHELTDQMPRKVSNYVADRPRPVLASDKHLKAGLLPSDRTLSDFRHAGSTVSVFITVLEDGEERGSRDCVATGVIA